ncbi:MAG: HNH endonuclease [Pseudomonadota bacterium]
MAAALDCLSRLRVGHSNGKPAPNKPCLLLAIICEIQAGHITSPLIPIDTRLIGRYHDLYEIASGQRNKANPWLPLWHLRSDQGPAGPLWRPCYLPSIEKVADQLGQPKSLHDISQRFAEAELDAECYLAMSRTDTAKEAAAILIGRYLARTTDIQAELHRYLDTAFATGEYEKHPEKLLGGSHEVNEIPPARSAAFRSLVLEAYDYRCAASRLRFITPDFRFLVEAAHLIPFAESQDDRPVNGLALTPNLHWAMDNHLIAPGPDHKWHVSPTVDSLVPDNGWLWEIDGKPLVLPRDSRWHPARDALAWRLDNLQH